MTDEFCLKMPYFHLTFRIFYMPKIYDMGQTALLTFQRRRAEDFFRPEKSDGFGRVWTREVGYQMPARYH